MPEANQGDGLLLVKRALLKFLREHGGIHREQKVRDRVAAVGRRISLAAGLKENSIRFFVLNDENVQAHFVFTGRVFINYGLYRELERDDELAAVLGHEVGHHVLLIKEGEKSCPWLRRRAEYVADTLSIEFLKKAGYDPKAILTVLERAVPRGLLFNEGDDFFYDLTVSRQLTRHRLNGIPKPGTPPSSHPLIFERIKEIKRQLGLGPVSGVIPNPKARVLH